MIGAFEEDVKGRAAGGSEKPDLTRRKPKCPMKLATPTTSGATFTSTCVHTCTYVCAYLCVCVFIFIKAERDICGNKELHVRISHSLSFLAFFFFFYVCVHVYIDALRRCMQKQQSKTRTLWSQARAKNI